MRTLEYLANREERVYLFFRDPETLERFISDAEKEGWHYRDGTSLRERAPQFRMALNPDHTVNDLGYAGSCAFDMADTIGGHWDSGQGKLIGGRQILRIDYSRYVAGEAEYVMPKQAK